MLAKILSQRHGFKCTVLFSLDADGTIDPKNTQVVVQSRRTRYRRRRRHAAADSKLAGRRHGAVRKAAARRKADHRAANEHARVQRIPEGQPMGDVELQQRRGIRKTCARRNVADALGTAQDRGHPRRDRAWRSRTIRCSGASATSSVKLTCTKPILRRTQPFWYAASC